MHGRVAVVTGGSTGIGLATAELLAQRGARLILFARSEADLARARERIGGGVTTVTGDVSIPKDVERLFAEVRARHGGLDALFVNAGIAEFVAFDEADLPHFERLFSVNVKGSFLTMKYALPLLRQGASVVFNSSVAAHIGAPLCSVYGASKAAVTALARNLATELLDRSIRVNVVSPGPTETPIQIKSQVGEEALGKMAPFVMSRMHLGRLGQAEEVAALVAFLLSDSSSFILGQDIAADGGMSGL